MGLPVGIEDFNALQATLFAGPAHVHSQTVKLAVELSMRLGAESFKCIPDADRPRTATIAWGGSHV